MPKLPELEIEGLKNQIETLSPQAMKQILFGMTNWLSRMPTMRAQDLIDFIRDAARYTMQQEKV